jgi:fructokinase
VGVGLVVNGKPIHGLMHPEGGHICISKLPDDKFNGYSWGENAPYRGACTVEGFASAVSIVERMGLESDSSKGRDLLKTLPDDHPAWDHVANALANLCVSLVLLVSVERIVLSGGIMLRGDTLFDKIRSRTRTILNGYVQVPQILDDDLLKIFICPSTWGNNAGVVGALNLAKVALQDARGGGGRGVKSRTDTKTLIQGVALGSVVTMALMMALKVCPRKR